MQAHRTLDTSSPEPQAPEPDMIRVRWPVAALALFGLLAALLAGAFLLARQSQAPAVTAPAATSAAAAPATVPSATPVPTVQPTSAPAPVVAAPTVAPSPSPTVDPQLAREVGTAYERYWQVRAEALLSLDVSQLGSAMADDELTAMERSIERLRGEGRAVKTDVTLNYQVVQATNSEAEVKDAYLSHSYFVDPSTMQAVEPRPTPETIQIVKRLRKIEGMWRVVGGALND